MPKSHLNDRVYKYLTALLGGSAVFFIFLVIIILLYYSYPSIIVNGLSFFTTVIWNPNLSGNPIVINGFNAIQGASYGILVFVIGTLISSGIALLLGIPAGMGIAIFLTQIAPKKISAPVSFLVELLAGIPSVVYGFWGFLVLAPFLLQSLEPLLAKYLSFIPIFSGTVYSAGMLTAGIVLALMIVPIIASISRDVMAQTPIELKEGAKALGLTNWEVTRRVVLPYAKTGIIGAIILGLGRALGETMAVAMVSGASMNILPRTAFYPINTMAAFMALSMDSAFTDPTNMYVYALVELGLVLLVITMIVNIIARALVKQGFIGSSDTAVRV